MEGQKNKNIFLCLSSNGENWMEAFRTNIGLLRNYYGWSVRVVAEKANISESTLNKIIQGITKDCDQSLTIKLAKVFNVSVDELIGAETIPTETRKTIAMSRKLKEHHRKVIRMYARHQYELHGENDTNSKSISVLTPICKNGHLKTTLLDKKICIDFLTKPTREKVSMGIEIPCDHYEPHFLKSEIVLLAFDREGENNEMCVISAGGNMYFCIKKIQFVDGKKEINYIAITNKKKVFAFDDVEDRLGYVVGWLEPDNPDDEDTTYSWGER